jgi:hypothetical protein
MSGTRSIRTEAWVFLAIARAGYDRLAPLDAVVACADHINATIPSRDELEQSVSALSAANLIVTEHLQLGLSPTGRRVFDGIESVDRSPRKQPPIAERSLRDTGVAGAVRNGWTVTDAEFRAAVALYNRRAKAAIANVKNAP